ncbi:hypothetical protein OA010_04335 [Luminiphilus sp.]|nr:hypothetical protein [Luminiphilus sp.]
MQHDADLLPEKTCEMLDLEYRRGIVSSAYVFVEHADDSGYVLNTDKLKSLEEKGFEIGYHQNALERAGYEHEVALELVEQDLSWLRKHFTIRSFVPHGGEPSSDGRNNEHLGHKGALKSLLWAYNGNCILKDYTWSDGGIRKRTPSDPRIFARSLVPGSRAMMLMHPQYYGDVLRDDWRSLPISNERWWRDLWGL